MDLTKIKFIILICISFHIYAQDMDNHNQGYLNNSHYINNNLYNYYLRSERQSTYSDNVDKEIMLQHQINNNMAEQLYYNSSN